ncbi:unnamed protein product, partial [Coccothraustes coccothraustes]
GCVTRLSSYFDVNELDFGDISPGFSMDLDQMNGLLPRQSMAFDVRFESDHQPQGDVDVLLPIEVTKGPTSHICFHATVLEVSLDVSKNRLQFSDILIEQCQRSYKNELKLNICGSSNHLKLHLSGQGLEPQLEFSPPALKLGQVLVDSDGVEATVVVKNPCNFPTEFYSLDFDEQYLEEEKILQMALESECQKSFLMPPRSVGGTLPPQVLEDYEAQKRLKTQQAKLKARAEAQPSAANKAVRGNHIEFGHCPVGEPCWRALTITSHEQTKVMLFEWKADAPFWFSPRVVKAVPEPADTVVEESSQEVEVYLSDVVAYVQFQDHPAERPPKVRWLRQPAKQQQDSGKKQQQDSKQQEEQVSKQQEEQPKQQQQEQPEQQDHSKKLRCSKQKNLSPKCVSSSLEVFPDVIHDLFSINPYRGTIAPGQKLTFHLQFSPKHAGKFKTTLLCRWETSMHLPTRASDGCH